MMISSYAGADTDAKRSLAERLKRYEGHESLEDVKHHLH